MFYNRKTKMIKSSAEDVEIWVMLPKIVAKFLWWILVQIGKNKLFRDIQSRIYKNWNAWNVMVIRIVKDILIVISIVKKCRKYMNKLTLFFDFSFLRSQVKDTSTCGLTAQKSLSVLLVFHCSWLFLGWCLQEITTKWR